MEAKQRFSGRDTWRACCLKYVSPACGMGNVSALLGLGLVQVVGSCLCSLAAVPRGRIVSQDNTALRGGYVLFEPSRFVSSPSLA